MSDICAAYFGFILVVLTRYKCSLPFPYTGDTDLAILLHTILHTIDMNSNADLIHFLNKIINISTTHSGFNAFYLEI
jgi:hypothetical protein